MADDEGVEVEEVTVQSESGRATEEAALRTKTQGKFSDREVKEERHKVKTLFGRK